MRNTTWSLSRDTSLGLNFTGVTYYDGQTDRSGLYAERLRFALPNDERNIGQGSPLKIARGQNALWNKGGLQYAVPIR